MTFIPYNLGLPNPPHDPADDVAGMQENTNSIGTWSGVDHVALGTSPSGWHKVIHFQNQIASPAPVIGTGQLYTLTFGPDIQLVYESALGVVTALTGTGNPSINGSVVLPGGIIMQWGKFLPGGGISSGSTTGTQLYNTPFPNGAFIVTGNPIISFSSLASSQGSLNIRQSSLGLGAKTGFDWQFFTSSNQYLGFTWFAIGF